MSRYSRQFYIIAYFIVERACFKNEDLSSLKLFSSISNFVLRGCIAVAFSGKGESEYKCNTYVLHNVLDLLVSFLCVGSLH